jgi:hypothetical protein
MERLVRGNPENLEYRNFYGLALSRLGSVLMEQGRGPDARAAYHEAIEQQRTVFARAPGRFRRDLEELYLARLLALWRLGRDGEVAALVREARAALEGEDGVDPARGPETAEHLVFLACLDAMEGVAAGRGPDGQSDDESARRRRTAERALGRLRQAVDIGYRDVAGLATEPALESLRRMAGFQDLLRDASFPANPFNR